MAHELVDVRPEIVPDHFASCGLPADGEGRALVEQMARVMRESGVEEMRVTIVSEEYPNAVYPNGLYMEGWSTAPHRHNPPGKAAPFNYPLEMIGG